MSRQTVIATYRTVLALLVVIALSYQYGLTRPSIPLNFFSYFTNLSNIIGAGIFLYCAVSRRRTLTVDLVRGAAFLYLAVTGVVFAILLSGDDLGSLQPWVNAVIHQIMPLVVVIDWLIDPPSSRLPLNKTMWWLVFPITYVAYSLIRGAIINWYPYPFFNPAKVGGYGGVAAYSVGIAIFFILLVLAGTGIGNRMNERRAKRFAQAA